MSKQLTPKECLDSINELITSVDDFIRRVDALPRDQDANPDIIVAWTQISYNVNYSGYKDKLRFSTRDGCEEIMVGQKISNGELISRATKTKISLQERKAELIQQLANESSVLRPKPR